MAQRWDVVVVGSGPNGMAAAVTMARAGLAVLVMEAQPEAGGGARTLDLGLVPGAPLRHDLCSAVHPLAVASPFFRAVDLAALGVRLVSPEVSYAQVLDDGHAAVAYRSMAATAAGLGGDGAAWADLLGPLVHAQDAVLRLLLGTHRRLPGDLAAAASLAVRMVEQGGPAWGRRFSGADASALLTGVAAHAVAPLPSLAAAGTALLLASLAHGRGWPIPVGGSQVVTDALAGDLLGHGGELRTGAQVRSVRDLPQARAVLFDTSAPALARIMADRLPAARRAALARMPFGGAVAKVDFVLSGPVPWADPRLGAAATVHLGGDRATMAAAASAVAAGRHPRPPMVLVSDPVVADPGREVDGRGQRLRPLWSYAQVPAGSGADLTESVTARIEAAAPGFRDVVVAARCVPAARMAEHDANYVGGDIAAGRVSAARMIARPSLHLDPYRVGPGVYLCSSATPPGPGVHGMCGWHAARSALRHEFGLPAPALAPER